MDTQALAAVAAAGAAIAAAAVSLIALPFTARAANAAKAQTALQRKIAEDASQPFVWVDIAGDPHQGQLIKLVLGNAGPTLARDVRVQITPDLPSDEKLRTLPAREVVMKRLNPGIQALAPGRTLQWPIGMGKNILKDDGHQIFTVTIDANGPFGPIPTLTYDLDLADFRESSDMPDGSLHHVRKAIDKLTKTIDDKG